MLLFVVVIPVVIILRGSKVQKEYYKRIRVVLKFKLNSGNVINAINAWAAGTVRYGTKLIYWNKAKLDKIEQQTQKLLNMHRGLHTMFFCRQVVDAKRSRLR